MRYTNNIEVILLSKHSVADPGQEELVKWLTTTLQPVIEKQHERIKKMFLRVFKDAPAIYLS